MARLPQQPCFFILGMNLLSIVENPAQIGVKVTTIITDKLHVIQTEDESTENKKDEIK